MVFSMRLIPMSAVRSNNGREVRPAGASRMLRIALAVAALVGFSTPAHAYIDPGTGGMLLQLLLGGVAGALVIAKLYWFRIKEGFQSIFGGGTKSEKSGDGDSGS
jgi:hypothetical protein